MFHTGAAIQAVQHATAARLSCAPTAAANAWAATLSRAADIIVQHLIDLCRLKRRNGDYYEKQNFSENRILRCFNRDKRNAYGTDGGFHA